MAKLCTFVLAVLSLISLSFGPAQAGPEVRVGTLQFGTVNWELGVIGDGNPLIMASREGHRAIVEILLDGGADVNRGVFGDENALINASWQGHLDVVRLLVDWGADVNTRVWAGREWRTALGMAWRGGHDDIVRFLESAGARE